MEGRADDGHCSGVHGALRHSGTTEIREELDDEMYRTVFTDYRDQESPLIGYSRDGSIAWWMVRVKVAS